jgi:hypothetical protein
LNEIKFSVKFKNPQIISKFQKDKLIVSILKPNEIKAFADSRVILGKDDKFVFLLPLQMESESEAQTLTTTATAVANGVKVLFASTSIGSIAMSALFIYLMGLINGLQI